MKLKEDFAQNFGKLSCSKKVLVAVSTGVDSMTLLDLILNLPNNLRPEVFVAYVDHQLRPESAKETAFITKFCARHKLKLFCARWNAQDHPSSGVEEAGRNFRYGFFKKAMTENHILELMTAHHADDQAETFLMKLLRGGDLAQLHAIEKKRRFEKRFWLIRPLLPFSKQKLLDYAKKRHLVYFEDSTNQNDDFLRNRLRHEVVPRLKKENKRFLEHVADYIAQLDDISAVAKKTIAEKIAEIRNANGSFSLSAWAKLAVFEQKLVLKEIIMNNHYFPSERQLEQVLTLLTNLSKPQGEIQFQENLFLKKEYNVFMVTKAKTTAMKKHDFHLKLRLGKWQNLPDGTKIGLFRSNIKLKKSATDKFFYFSDSSRLPLNVRHRLMGDRISLKIGKKKLKKVFIEQKVPQQIREEKWLVADSNGEVLWAIGIRKSDLSEQKVNDKMQYMVIFRNNTEK
ncbi:tRNA lysidine(34) synthetase TilS [Liquorilactobacillus oeni]|uniref:tRNA(Ile)-lysidine synthase n=1 Tax=Liquorilactobacillus oeni DSM 19972 TaxID=1423777 RepID=A0A0R1MNW5_9LACO|nr:tRNA lysidine(34) synthetase TilS [Liquorilactobacillus oeni]KRL06243.1 tRNA(Ile)-lysidine synthase [Liquorilactobacillus oeni DSM 19972]